jgi:hypothetical protein
MVRCSLEIAAERQHRVLVVGNGACMVTTSPARAGLPCGWWTAARVNSAHPYCPYRDTSITLNAPPSVSEVEIEDEHLKHFHETGIGSKALTEDAQISHKHDPRA